MEHIGSIRWKVIQTAIITSTMNVSTKLQSGTETNMYVTKRSMPNTLQGTLFMRFSVRVWIDIRDVVPKPKTGRVLDGILTIDLFISMCHFHFAL